MIDEFLRFARKEKVYVLLFLMLATLLAVQWAAGPSHERRASLAREHQAFEDFRVRL